MRKLSSFLHILTIFLTLITTALARQPPTSFCKCICFQNSTIIPLNSPQTSPDDADAGNNIPNPNVKTDSRSSLRSLFTREEDEDGHDPSVHHRLTCNDCTRAFCLDYNLPICKGATDEDVFTSCFQRDSLKDETIVLVFVITTTALLAWAVLKPWIDRLRDTETAQKYVPIGRMNPGASSRRAAGEGELPAYRVAPSTGTGFRTRGRGESESFARQGGLNS